MSFVSGGSQGLSSSGLLGGYFLGGCQGALEIACLGCGIRYFGVWPLQEFYISNFIQYLAGVVNCVWTSRLCFMWIGVLGRLLKELRLVLVHDGDFLTISGYQTDEDHSLAGSSIRSLRSTWDLAEDDQFLRSSSSYQSLFVGVFVGGSGYIIFYIFCT